MSVTPIKRPMPCLGSLYGRGADQGRMTRKASAERQQERYDDVQMPLDFTRNPAYALAEMDIEEDDE